MEKRDKEELLNISKQLMEYNCEIIYNESRKEREIKRLRYTL